MEYAVGKLSDSDVGKIQERSYTAQDRIDIAWQDYQLQNTGKPISRDEFLDLMVQGFRQPIRRRANGKQLVLHD